MVNRDPYFMVSYNPYIPGSYNNPLYTLNSQGFFSLLKKSTKSFITFAMPFPANLTFGAPGTEAFHFRHRTLYLESKVKDKDLEDWKLMIHEIHCS